MDRSVGGKPVLPLTMLVLAALSACTAVDEGAVSARGWMPTKEFKTCQPATDTNPRLIRGKAPSYPISMLLDDDHKRGHAIVGFTVNAEGRVVDPTVIEASYPYFGTHLVHVLKDWRFSPARHGSVAVDVHCVFRNTFIADKH
jgi:TonB family protein